MATEEIKFYSTSAAYVEFSNMHLVKLSIDGQFWRSVEHYYQAMKFSHDENYLNYMETIRTTPSPFKAKSLGGNRSYQIRPDWETYRNVVMLKALRAKFDSKTNPKLANKLISTGTAQLTEDSKDKYWGNGGPSNNGKNTLGKLLMQVRAELLSQRLHFF